MKYVHSVSSSLSVDDLNLLYLQYGRTALIHAAQNGSIKTAKVLLESGAVAIDEGDKVFDILLVDHRFVSS